MGNGVCSKANRPRAKRPGHSRGHGANLRFDGAASVVKFHFSVFFAHGSEITIKLPGKPQVDIPYRPA
jgi:hypothetical protein